MKKIYGKLAVTNMKNNKQLYLPYLLTAMLSVVMFYTMVALRYNSGIRQIRGGENLLSFLGLGQWVIGIFVVIFLFYTNNSSNSTSAGSLKSPRGLTETVPTFTPSGIQFRLNCCLKKRV